MQVEWIPIDKKTPEVDEDGYSDYILVSFSNYPLIDIAQYREDKEGGTYYPEDGAKSYSSVGLMVNAWMPMIPRYKEVS